MKCLQVTDMDGSIELMEAGAPDVGPSDVLVDVDATSVGRTIYNNVHYKLSADSTNLPRIPGHEIVGRVADVGSGVTAVSEGDLVTTHYYLFCGHCEYCESGFEPLCEHLRGQVGVDIDGGYAEYVRLPERNVVRLPEDIDPVEATAVPDAIATPYHVADRRAEIGPGDEVMVLGAGGGVGIHLVQMAIYFGGSVTAVDQRRNKLDACSELGATATVDTRSESVTALERSYDAIVDFTGSVELIEEALDLIAPHGRFVHLTPFEQPFDLAPRDLVWNEFDVVGSRYCSRYEIRRSAALVADGTIEPIITEVTDLGGVPDLLETIAAGDHLGRGAVTP